jgi:hypothetical protein
MRPKLNLKDKGQISKPNEYTDMYISFCQSQIKTPFALGHRVRLFRLDLAISSECSSAHNTS